MPTYQYACTECGHQLEAVQSFSDDPLTECPTCGGKLRKQFSAVGIVFKGSGFYRTDSRSTSSASAGTDGTGKDKDSGKKDGKNDSGKKDGASTSTEKAASASSGSTSKASSDTGTSSKGSSSKKPVGTSS